ncbi:WD40 repeat protein [Actinocorallia herbida]|uniref:WD40 repeat protein n=1 Tax=Actinocorallia herbida TaxID=58109 RepID=A0A3N1CWT0_9ACTN|nr:WD40 repeat domain-containing protein [Actinocorallia herbida]ROO85751.1 WD40 repeat protein [Actinocorallia herbida]
MTHSDAQDPAPEEPGEPDARGRLGRRTAEAGAGIRRRAAPGLVFGMAAGAFATVLAPAGLVVTGFPDALVTVLASVGANVLTEVLMNAVRKLRPDATREEAEAEIQRSLDQAVGDETRAALLLRELADVPQQMHLVRTHLEEVVSERFSENSASLPVAFQDLKDTLEEIHALVLADRAPARHGESAAPARWTAEPPYRGLAMFHEGHAPLFFGRAAQTAALVRKLRGRLGGPGILAVTGASGVGKSSFLRAGLLHALADPGAVPGREREDAAEVGAAEMAAWPSVVMTPGESPLRALAQALAGAAAGNAVGFAEELAADPAHARQLAGQALVQTRVTRSTADSVGPLRLLLVIDQFEELFLHPEISEDDRRAFVAALEACVTARPGADPPVVAVIGLRSDQKGRCDDYPLLREMLQEAEFILPSLSRSGLRVAIRGPAQAAGLRIGGGLVAHILDELGPAGESGGSTVLPLLSQAMLRTWHHRRDGEIDLRAYDLAGGVGEAVERSAEEAYAELDEAHREAAERVFRKITRITAAGAAPRWAPHSVLTDVDRAVLRPFAARRLVLLTGFGAGPAHQVLLAAWPKLAGWLAADAADWRRHAELAADARRYAPERPDASFLYTGTLLREALDAVERWDGDPGRYPEAGAHERVFLRDSVRAREAAAAAEAARRERERRRRRIRGGVFGAMAALLLAAVLAIVRIGGDSGEVRAAGLSRQLAARSAETADPVLSALLAAAAWRTAPTAEARYALREILAGPHRRTLERHLGAVTSVAYSPDGRHLASAGTDSAVQLWDAGTYAKAGPALLGHEDAVTALAFADGGATLATAGARGLVQLWDVASRRRTATLATGAAPVVFSPDGRLLLAGDRIWDVAARRPSGERLGVPVRTGAFSPDGRTLATVEGEDRVRLWDTTARREIRAPLDGAHVAFSPDGSLFLAASAKGRVRLWRTSTWRALPDRTGCATGSSVLAAAFAPKGTVFALACADGSLAVRDASGRPVVAPIPVGARGLAFSRDGGSIATAGDDGKVRVWSASAPLHSVLQERSAPLGSDGVHLVTGAPGNGDWRLRSWHLPSGRTTALDGQQGWTRAIAFTADGARLATASDDTIRLWDPGSGKVLLTIDGAESVHDLRFSPDGRTLLAAEAVQGYRVRRWEVETGRLLSALVPKVDPAESIGSMGYLRLSPDGSRLAAIEGDDLLRVWNLARGRPVGRPSSAGDGRIEALAFSPDGRRIATGGSDRAVRLWDADGRALGRPLTGHTDDIRTVAFSADGHTVASGGRDGTVRLWDTGVYRPVGEPLTGAENFVSDLVFPKGTGLVAAATDYGTLRVWRTGEPADLVAAVCATAGRALTRAEWTRHGGGEDFQPGCPAGAVFPALPEPPAPSPLSTAAPGEPKAVPATAAQFAPRYLLALDGPATKAAFRPEAPDATYPLQRDLDQKAGIYQADRPVTLAPSCPGADCALALSGFALDPAALTFTPDGPGVFRARAGNRSWTLRATGVTTSVTTFTVTYEITDPSGAYSGSMVFHAVPAA